MSALDPLPADARMDAYYYSFDRTGVGAIDRVLSAVATAGKRAHLTEDWNDGYHGAPSCVEEIQAAAEASAKEVRDLRRQIAEEIAQAIEAEHVDSGMFCCFSDQRHVALVGAASVARRIGGAS